MRRPHGSSQEPSRALTHRKTRVAAPPTTSHPTITHHGSAGTAGVAGMQALVIVGGFMHSLLAASRFLQPISWIPPMQGNHEMTGPPSAPTKKITCGRGIIQPRSNQPKITVLISSRNQFSTHPFLARRSPNHLAFELKARHNSKTILRLLPKSRGRLTEILGYIKETRLNPSLNQNARTSSSFWKSCFHSSLRYPRNLHISKTRNHMGVRRISACMTKAMVSGPEFFEIGSRI